MVRRVRLSALLLLLGLASVCSQVEVVDDVGDVGHASAIGSSCGSRLRLAIVLLLHQDVASAVRLAGGLAVFLHLYLGH